ncbi:MAG: hypothetical protein KQH67_03025 [Bacteroidetes bacterium]|nr:hypothetical protein [Bacteroidota bacterium]
MKSIVISDIDYNDKGIMPYALRLARDLDSEVKVIHVIDTRTLQGIYTPYSDSQSVTAGVESYDEIIEKEKHTAHDNLRKHVGRESSMLNYPLRVTYEVIVGNIDKVVTDETESSSNSLLMLSGRPKGKIWETYEDVFHIVARSKNPVWLIPPGQSYKIPKNVLFISNLEDHESEHLKSAVKMLKPMEIQLNALETSGKPNLKSAFEEQKNWHWIAKDIEQYYTLEDNNATRIKQLTTQKNIELIILFEKKRNLIKRVIGKSITEKLAEILDIPMLVFYD